MAIALFPFIFLKSKDLKQNTCLINHEKIHLRQQLELLVIFFYIAYLIEYLIRVLQYKNTYQAYRAISFEREAYDNEKNLDFLKSRKIWNFISYF